MMAVVEGARPRVAQEVGARARETGRTVWLVLLAVGVAACSDDAPARLRQLEPPPAQGSPSVASSEKAVAAPKAQASGAQEQLGQARPGMVWATGTVNNRGGRQVGPRKDVIDVCVYEQGDLPCTKTDERGAFSIQVPAHSEVALVFRGQGLTPTLRAFLTAEQPVALGNSRVADAAGVTRVVEGMGKKYQPKASVMFFGGVEGVVAEVLDGGGVPFYLDIAGRLIEGATSIPMHGTGGIFNIKPGRARVRFKLAGGRCAFRKDNILSGWPDPSAPDVVRVPLAPGHHTHMVTMFCEPAAATSAPQATSK